MKENVIIGGILLGDTRGKDDLQGAIQRKRDISSFRKDLGDERFDFTRLR